METSRSPVLARAPALVKLPALAGLGRVLAVVVKLPALGLGRAPVVAWEVVVGALVWWTTVRRRGATSR